MCRRCMHFSCVRLVDVVQTTKQGSHALSGVGQHDGRALVGGIPDDAAGQRPMDIVLGFCMAAK